MASKLLLFVCLLFGVVGPQPSVIQSHDDTDKQDNCDAFVHDLQAEIQKLRSSSRASHDFVVFDDKVTDIIVKLPPDKRSELPAYFRTCDQVELFCLFVASCPFPEFAPFPFDDGAQPSYRETMSKLVCSRLVSDVDFRREYHHYVAWSGVLKTASENDFAKGLVEQKNRNLMDQLSAYTLHCNSDIWSHRLTLYLYSDLFSFPMSIKFVRDEFDPLSWRKKLIEYLQSNEFVTRDFRYEAKPGPLGTDAPGTLKTTDSFEYLPPIPSPISPYSTPDDLLRKILEQCHDLRDLAGVR